MKQTLLSEWLDDLQSRLPMGDTQRQCLEASLATPWWLGLLQGIAAWFSALFIVAAFLAPLVSWWDEQLAMLIAAAGLLAVSLWLFRRDGVYAAHLALAFSLSGQALVVFALTSDDGMLGTSLRNMALVGLPLAALLLLPRTSDLHRFVCSLLVLGNLAVLVGFGPGLMAYGLVVSGVACMLWLSRRQWAVRRYASRIRALTSAATLVAVLLALYGHEQISGTWVVLFDPFSYRQWAVQAYRVGAVLILLMVAAWLLRPLPGRERFLALAVVALLALLANPAPGLVVSAALWLAVFHARSHVWSILMGCFAMLYLGALYYSMHISLLEKSLVLIATGGAMLLFRVWLRRIPVGRQA